MAHVKLSECRAAYQRLGLSGVYKIFLTHNDTLAVHSDGTVGNGTERAVIRVDAVDFEGMDKRQAARDIQRRFAILDS